MCQILNDLACNDQPGNGGGAMGAPPVADKAT